MTKALPLLSLLFALPAQAAVFDAADILPQNSGAVSGFTEIILSDPTSEGLEARGRYGLSDDWNLGLNLGAGSKNKKFRIGGEAVFNLLPDWEGQVGVSILANAVYLRRYDTGGLQTRIGPMVHKRVTAWNGYPANIYLAIPWYQEIRGSTFSSGTQLVLGTVFDIAQASRYYAGAEVGIKLAKTDSYILLGLGARLGDLKFNRGEESKKGNVPARAGNRASKSGSNTGGTKDEYTDEDFE